jgi:hypothetical protein
MGFHPICSLLLAPAVALALPIVSGCSADGLGADVTGSDESVATASEALVSQSVPMHLPVTVGEWWELGQRFNQGTHVGRDAFAADIARPDAPTLGESVLSPVDGIVAEAVAPFATDGSPNPQGGGFVKVNVSGNCATPLPTSSNVADPTHGTPASDCVQWVPIHMSKVTTTVGAHVGVGSKVGEAGDTGTTAGNYHIHTGLAVAWANTWQTIDQKYVDYQVSTNDGSSWDVVANGLPQTGEWFRRMPPWTDWTSLGATGRRVGTPAVVAGEIYTRSVDDDIRQLSANGNQWGSWFKPFSGNVSSSPSVASTVSGTSERVLVVRRVVNGLDTVWAIRRNSGTWGAWTDLGGSIFGDPVVVWFKSKLHVLARGTNQRLWRKILNSDLTTNQDWLQQDPGVMKSSPGAAATSSFLYVYETKSDNTVYQNYDDGSGFTGWASIGGQTPAAPAVIAQTDGQVKVFVRGLNDDRLWQRVWHGSFWTSWYPSGLDESVSIADSPAVFRLADDRVDVFARRSDGGIWEKFQSQ